MNLDLKGSDIPQRIYDQYIILRSFQKQFDTEVQTIYDREMNNNSNIDKDSYSQQSGESEQISQSFFGGTVDPKNKFIQGLADSLKIKLKTAFSESSPYFLQGLDNSEINLTNLEHTQNEVQYDKQTLKSITFLMTGFLTQKKDASSYFEDLKKVQSKSNLFVYFRWKSSSWFDALFKLANCYTKEEIRNLTREQKSTYKGEWETFLQNILSSNLPSHLTNIFYTLVRVIFFFLSTSYLGIPGGFGIQLVISIINFYFTFNETVEVASQSGQVLANLINKDLSHLPIKIDLMGHSLGTVVISNALIDLKNRVRYVILMGGVATIEDIQNQKNKFEMCYNFYSSSDDVLSLLLNKLNLLGERNYTGINGFSENNQNLKSERLNFEHQDYSSHLYTLYQRAIQKFEEPINNINQKANQSPNQQTDETSNILLLIGAVVAGVGVITYAGIKLLKFIF